MIRKLSIFVLSLAAALVGADRFLPFRAFAGAEVVAVGAVGAGFTAFRLGGLVAGDGFGTVVVLGLVFPFEQRVGFDRDREFGLQLDGRCTPARREARPALARHDPRRVSAHRG